MNRPGSSLGINGYVNGNGNGVNGVGRARRVTMEERYRQEREREAELEGGFFFVPLLRWFVCSGC
jgi:hypothetical protein